MVDVFIELVFMVSLYPTWFRWKPSPIYLFFLAETLYIPHGSDESASLTDFARLSKSFISHMVQMKGGFRNSDWSLPYIFISHMVQMKGTDLTEGGVDPKTLYPTWFRWKSTILSYTRSCKSLYIPHGSDESGADFALLFTSNTLYPTWFRWKCMKATIESIEDNFISHMVQMKA